MAQLLNLTTACLLIISLSANAETFIETYFMCRSCIVSSFNIKRHVRFCIMLAVMLSSAFISR